MPCAYEVGRVLLRQRLGASGAPDPTVIAKAGDAPQEEQAKGLQSGCAAVAGAVPAF